VVQLQLLELMIPKECGAVPVDAATRADLIDLMARALVAVFHEEGRSVNDRGLVQSQDQTGASTFGLAMSNRRTVTRKKNRSAVIVALMLHGETPREIKSSW